jgi:uncharacterized protein (TIGR00251 family)
VEQKEQVIITVQVQPNAKQNKVIGFGDSILKVKIAAPPIKGRANKELIKFLSSLFGISKSDLSIEKGKTSKTKAIAIRGLGQNGVLRELEKYQTD